MRAVRAVVAAGVAVALPLLAGGVAGADPATDVDLIVTATAWYSAVAADGASSDPLSTSFGGTDLPVGAAGGSELRRSYLAVRVPKGATNGSLLLPLSATTGANVASAGPVRACRVTAKVEAHRGASLASAPPFDCQDASPGEGVAASDGSIAAFRFDLAKYLGDAQDATLAVALVADLASPQPPFQVTFDRGIGDTAGTVAVDGAPAPFSADGSPANEALPPLSGWVDTSPIIDVLASGTTTENAASGPRRGARSPSSPALPAAQSAPAGSGDAVVWGIVPLVLAGTWWARRSLGTRAAGELERMLG